MDVALSPIILSLHNHGDFSLTNGRYYVEIKY